MSGERTLKIKKQLHYRKVGESAPKVCRLCGHRKLVPIYRIGGELHKHDYRCEIIGLHNSIRYAVRDDHVCDRFAYFPKKTEQKGGE